MCYFGDARQNPAQPLSALGLAAPGCLVHVASTFGALDAPAVAGSASFLVSVPNLASLLGIEIVTQSLSLSSANPAGLATSNGIEGTIGR